MTDHSVSTTWSAEEAQLQSDERMLTLERQLALVDRILGLEAEVAQLAARTSLTPTEQLAAELQVQRMRSSPAWRIGRIATAPVRTAKRALHRGPSE